jgi:hypothetical protein
MIVEHVGENIKMLGNVKATCLKKMIRTIENSICTRKRKSLDRGLEVQAVAAAHRCNEQDFHPKAGEGERDMVGW